MTVTLRSVCVYCGSNLGRHPSYAGAAAHLGKTIAQRGIRLVYGGGRVGLMGVMADAALETGGEVIGVITEALIKKEVAHQGLTELHVVTSMHERKSMMADRSDCFIMLPGGYGTLDEFFEALTWTQLGIHDKPCGILDVEDFFRPFMNLIESMVAERFVRPEHARMLVLDSDVSKLLERIQLAIPVRTGKWLD